MKISKILREERRILAREAIEPALLTYITSREKALEGIDLLEFKENLRGIRDRAIQNLTVLMRKAGEELGKRGIKTFYARDAREARKIVLKLIPKGSVIAKSKSNLIKEIGLLKALRGRNEVIETDVGDFIVQIAKEKATHPVTPAIHIPLKRIARKMRELGIKAGADAREIVDGIKNQIRERVQRAEVALTGANAISSDGTIFILENEGNISLITRIAKIHLILAGIDKLVERMEDALQICKALAIWGGGISLPSYINIISSPSQTSDVGKKKVYGVHGAKEVYLILVDNGRTKAIKEGMEELLQCIGCGACLYFCPVYLQIFDHYGSDYFGGRGVGMAFLKEGLREAFSSGLYLCTNCNSCKEDCPLGIDIPLLVRKIRERAVKEGKAPRETKQMAAKIKRFGNPFGKAKEGKIPRKLYCC
jgi:iron-sulfur cluster protein